MMRQRWTPNPCHRPWLCTVGALFTLALVCSSTPSVRAQTSTQTDPPAPTATPAAPPSDLPLIAAAWPKRITIPGHDGALGVIRPVEAPLGLSGFQPGPFQFIKPSAEDKADAWAIAGDHEVEFEGPGSFILTLARPRPGQTDPVKRRQPIAAFYFKFISAELAASAAEHPEAPHLLQRTWFAFYDPPEGGGVAPRGVALVMPGLFNTPEPVIELVITKLRARGWAVLRMMAQPSRFTEQLAFSIDRDHLDASAVDVARVMGDRAAECAYAVEAAFGHVAKERPDLAKLTRIALGMSGGAMTLPTVVAREPSKYAAAVLIAGGADFLAIAQESNYRFIVDSITFEWHSPPPDPARLDEFNRLYLEAAALDSYHTAATLAGKPVLLIHGTHDGAVPSHLGDLLWDRLGRPERWPDEAGHEEIFAHLPQKTPQILDWLDKKLHPAP